MKVQIEGGGSCLLPARSLMPACFLSVAFAPWGSCAGLLDRPLHHCAAQSTCCTANSFQNPCPLPCRPLLPALQNFLYTYGLQTKPIFTMGVSAGGAFALKIPKAFYSRAPPLPRRSDAAHACCCGIVLRLTHDAC